MKHVVMLTAALLLASVSAGVVRGSMAVSSLAAPAKKGHAAQTSRLRPPLKVPAYFNLTVTGKAAGGATVTTFLVSRRIRGLVVAPLAGVKKVCTPAGCTTGGVPGAVLGWVPLGSAPAGTSTNHWNLQVNGKALKPGVYYVFMEIFTSGGAPSGLFCRDAAAVQVLPNGADVAAVFRQ